MINDATGFGIYDRVVLDEIRKIGDPYPYFRGLISELGFPVSTIEFVQPRRIRGITKNNLYTLYDIAMLGFVSHSKIPLRIATFLGFAIGFLSLISAILLFSLKLIFWDKLPAGIAPVMIVLFLLFGIIMIFIGILGEYIASIHTYVQKRPVVVERERINFE
jgi:dolichol-phosphate mannosyltransferase